MEQCCNIWEKFGKPEMVIKEFEYWTVLVRPKQVTLGSAVIVLNEHRLSFGELLPEEGTEIPNVIRWFEDKCEKVFSPEKFNYIAAMMKDNHVHFHAFPRYSKEKDWGNMIWKDSYWPLVIGFEPTTSDKEIIMSIQNILSD